MLEVLVVDEQDDRRAEMVDALCELPGVEVVATAFDAACALASIDARRVDAVVAASDLAGAAVVTLIDGMRRRGLSEIVVVVGTRLVLPGIRQYWRDLGARAVVDSLGDLAATVQLIAQHHRRLRERKRAQPGDRVVHTTGSSAVVTETGVSPRTAAATYARHHAPTTPEVALGEALRDALPRLAKLVHDEIELVLEAVDDLPHVQCSIIDIERIALHLVRDAATAVPLGGKVWLFVERQGHRHVRLEVLDSSGTSRTPSPIVDTARVIAERNGGALHVVDLGRATSLHVILPASVAAPN